MAGALDGLKILDLTRVLAGPYTTMVLADMGADVIKIEEPTKGDDSRQYGPFIGTESAYFMSLNRDKKSMTLNLKAEKGKEIFKRLVEQADVVVENYRPGTMEKLGLSYDVLKEINPRLIFAACSGFGQTGPDRHKPAYDIIVQGAGGLMGITGYPDGPPTRVGASVGDITAGLFTAIGILTALHARTVSGVGQMVDVSMLDCQVAILENAIARYAVTGEVPGRIGNHHPSITPFDVIKTKKHHVIIAIGNDSLWVKLCDVLGIPDVAEDPRFLTNADRTKNRAYLYPILEAGFLKKTAKEWLRVLEKAGIPCGPVNRIDEIMNDPQVKARDMIIELEHPVAGKLKMPGTPIKLSETPGSIVEPAPLLGEHTFEILGDMLGMTEEEILALKEEKVL